jgi:hypothetical protein
VIPLPQGLPGVGKNRLLGGTVREAISDGVNGLRREATALKEEVTDLTIENSVCSRRKA